MIRFIALHYIAAQRGDGLRPELVRLLERCGRSESERTSAAQAVGENLSALDLTDTDSRNNQGAAVENPR